MPLAHRPETTRGARQPALAQHLVQRVRDQILAASILQARGEPAIEIETMHDLADDDGTALAGQAPGTGLDAKRMVGSIILIGPLNSGILMQHEKPHSRTATV